MDTNESEQKLRKNSTSSSTRRPLVPAENKNGSTRSTRPKEVSSRYKSPTSSSTDRSKRSPSPVISRAPSTSTSRGTRQSISAERTRVSRPSSPVPSSTPVQDTNSETLSTSRKVAAGNKLPEALWPSTMRSLSVSFQSDMVSVPVNKKDKPVSPTISDRNLRSSSNAPSLRKPTPERKRSPLKGKVAPDQAENSKPVDGPRSSRLVDQHKWPSRATGIVSSSSMNRSVDLTEKKGKIPYLSRPVMVAPPARRLSLDGATRPLEKSSSDLLMEMSHNVSLRRSVDDFSLRVQRPGSSSSSDRTRLANAAARALTSPAPASRPSSPSLTRGVSPVRGKAAVSSSSRGPSPVRARPSSPSRQPQGQGNKASVLSFIADIKQGQKAANHIEDVHQLRMLYNRHLQWRFANAQGDAASFYQKVNAEKLLYGVWRMILHLQESVREKRNFLQHLRIKLKLYSVLKNQWMFLDDWASMETDHANSLNWAIQDLQASTIQIPVTGGAKGDTERVMAAICAAADVMQEMGSSMSFLLPLVEAISRLVSDLASLSADERAMLEECKSLLSCATATQVKENSLRTHIIQQTKQSEASRVL